MFNSDKIKFYSTIKGVDKVMPIIPAKGYVHEWKTEAIKQYNVDKKHFLNKPVSMGRCPGINLFQSQGWLVRTWQDVVIETYGNDNEVRWYSAMDQKSLDNNDFISFHDSSLFKHIKNYPLNTLKSVVKFNTGWKCKVPKGYILYQVPVAFADENRFTTISGVYTSDMGIASLNIPVYWHLLEQGKTLIPAGTPIAQLILAPAKSYDYEIGEIDSDLIAANNILLNNTFLSTYKHLKDFWKNN